ncbi:MAG: hypothetical protein H7123_03900 [Thermoleophilia bacterium]|nr:hypothetical protein [Thermoleophilia bacterium]
MYAPGDDGAQILKKLRERALAVPVIGVGKSGSLFPGLKVQVDTIGSVQAKEAYTYCYRNLSSLTHMGAESFNMAGLSHEPDGGLATFTDLGGGLTTGIARQLGVTVFASTLVMASSGANLGIDERVDEIKRLLIPHETPLQDR